MDNENKPQTLLEVCSIRIGFPVKSDEEAIEYKKKISEVLANIPTARIEFSIVRIPNGVDIRPANS